jgi:2-polyprenyl-3-methyl-5-hydroxy-6-metoxy-1,4-benzoquinol methylase
MTTDTQRAYDNKYTVHNYFRYYEWLYRPYISSLISYCEMPRGASVLDVGCGQGFFSYLLNQLGMRVQGIDISESGVRAARQAYGKCGIVFEVADIETAQLQKQFDCVFVRSCSLYNTATFPMSEAVTDKLLSHVKSNGTFIFLYNTNFSRQKSVSWRYHSLADLRNHFDKYTDPRLFFSSRIDARILGKRAFSPFFTRANMLASRTCGTGGDLICVLKKP